MKITIVDYTPSWINQFETERNKIQIALSKFSPVVEHIGSTSIKGLGAKPIIDMMVGLTSEQQLDLVAESMIESGYTYLKKYNSIMPYRRFFQK